METSGSPWQLQTFLSIRSWGLSVLGSGCGWNAPFVAIDNTVVFRGTSFRVSGLEGTIFD